MQANETFLQHRVPNTKHKPLGEYELVKFRGETGEHDGEDVG